MFSFFKKKKRPQFWQDYEASFSEKTSEYAKETNFVVLDTETTGFHLKKDRIISIGAVKIKGHAIEVQHTFELYIHQNRFNPDTVKIHGITKNDLANAISEEEAISLFLKYIGNSVLVAHHKNFDLGMINQALNRMNLPKLQNKSLDTGSLYKGTRIISNLIDREKKYSLDEVAEAFSIDTKDRHTAAGDAFITAIAFLKITGRLDKKGNLKLKELFRY